MNKYSILVIIIINIVVTTVIAAARPQDVRWPPRENNYFQANQYSFQQPWSYQSGWKNNYVSSNYDPYINLKQFRSQALPQYYSNLPIQTNLPYYPMAASPLFPIFGNTISLPPAMMTYNPWIPGFGVMPLVNIPAGWAY